MIAQLAVLATSAWALAAPGRYELRGSASDARSGKPVYTEVHRLERDERGFDRRIETDYVAPDGRVIARIRSDFAKDLHAPDTEFSDLRHGIEQKAVLDVGARKLEVTRTQNGATKKATLAAKGDFIVGQGFNNYVKSRFAELEAGRKMLLRFAVLEELDDFAFQALKQPATKENPEERATFALSLDSWLLRQFVSSIQVSYDRKDKALRRYEGLSNLLNDEQKGWAVVIDYGPLKPLD